VARSIAAIAQPLPPGLKSALSAASSSTPPKPTASPEVRQAPSLSPSHRAPINAVKIGTVALRMDASPAVIDSMAQAISTKGSAELNTPISAMPVACWRSTPCCPRRISKGARQSAATATRNQISGTGPKAGAA